MATTKKRLGKLDVSNNQWGTGNYLWDSVYKVPAGVNTTTSTCIFTNSSNYKRVVGLRVLTGWDGATYPITGMTDGDNVIPAYVELNPKSRKSLAEVLYLNFGHTVVAYSDSPSFTISSITYSGTTATVTTMGAHGLATGDRVNMVGCTPSAYNGLWGITVTGATTFTYVMASNPGANASGTILCVLAGVGIALFGREDTV